VRALLRPISSRGRRPGATLTLGNLCFFTAEGSQNLDEAISFAKEFGSRQIEIRRLPAPA